MKKTNKVSNLTIFKFPENGLLLINFPGIFIDFPENILGSGYSACFLITNNEFRTTIL